jgi:hypothetical protein
VRQVIILLFGFFSITSVAFAQLSGTVTNGTKGKPASGVEVQLVILGQGMEVAGKATTDAQGRFSFTADLTKPMMARATYQGINYHEVHSPGQSSVDLKVYETASEGRFNVDEMMYIVQQSQDQLLVGRQYVVSNNTTPPVTLSKTNGVFTFTLPGGTKPERVSAVGTNNMPIPVAARPAGENSWTIEYPLRPGETRFFLVSQFPYQDRKAALRESLPWPAKEVKLYVPPQMKVEAPGFQSAGTEQGLAAYTLASAKAGAEVAWTVSGEAPPMTGPDEGGETSNEAAGRVQIVPGPVNENRWIIMGILAGVFIISSVFAVRRSASARRASEGG